MTTTAKKRKPTGKAQIKKRRKAVEEPRDDVMAGCSVLFGDLWDLTVRVSLNEIAAWKPSQRAAAADYVQAMRTWAESGLAGPQPTCPLFFGEFEEDAAAAAQSKAVSSMSGGNGRVEKKATQPKPKKKKPSSLIDAAGETRDIEVTEIYESELNPRSEFDQAELKKLAASLKQHGLLQNLVVVPGIEAGYELIAGARRLRAAKLAQLGTVRCQVLDVTEEEAIEMRGVENLERENLNPIEKALWYQQMLNLCGHTQTSLAKRLGIKQPTIANALRLLELPQVWQQRIISQEIPPTHTRCLMPWKDRPAVLKAIEEHLGQYVAWDEMTVDEFSEDVQKAVHGCSRNANPNSCSKDVPLFEITPAIEKELDLQVVDGPYHSKQKRAFNVERWEELQKEAKATKRAADKKAREKDAKQSGGTSAKEKTEETVNDHNAVEAKAGKFLCHLIADALHPKKHAVLVQRLAMLLFYDEWQLMFCECLRKVRGSQGIGWLESEELWDEFGEVADKDWSATLARAVQGVLRHKEMFEFDKFSINGIDIGVLKSVVVELGIDPLAAWEPTTDRKTRNA